MPRQRRGEEKLCGSFRVQINIRTRNTRKEKTIAKHVDPKPAESTCLGESVGGLAGRSGLRSEPGFQLGLLQIAQFDASVDAFDRMRERLIGSGNLVRAEELRDIVTRRFRTE